MDLRGGRMRIGLLNPIEDTLALARAVAAQSCRVIQGGWFHSGRIVGSSVPEQSKSRITPTFLKPICPDRLLGFPCSRHQLEIGLMCLIDLVA